MSKIVFYLLLLISINACKKPGITNGPVGIDISTGTWRISYFLDQQIKTSNYTGYYFMFLTGGTFMAHGSTNVITGTLSIVLIIFAGIMILTSLFSICPLYMLLGLNSRKAKE